MIDTIQKVSSLTLGNGLSSISSDVSTTGIGAGIGIGPTPGQATGASFADVLGSMAKDTLGTLKQAEAASFEGIKGTANTREVVDAVLSAEQSLQTAIALRDKIVAAYLDITKMQI